MLKRFTTCIFSFFILVGLYCNAAYGLGSGGFRNEVVDSEAGGKGYSFVAQADGPSAVHYNPAGLTQLKGDYVSLGYTLEAPRFECKSNATGNTVQMQKTVFLVPNFYYVTDLNNERLRFGLAATSPYGLSTDWANDSFAGLNSEESDLEMFNINPAVAYKVNDSLSVAAGVDYFVSHISKHRVIAAALSNGGDFQLKGNDDGWGYNLGVLFKPSEKHRIGVSYRSEIDLTYVGTVTLDNLNVAGQFIFGNNSYTTATETDSTIPRSCAVGYAYQPDDKWTFEADIEWTDWSCVESELLTYPDENAALRLNALNDGNPVSRDWNDVFSFGFGTEYKATDRLALRCGYLYHPTPIPSANVDAALPDSNKHGITCGFGYRLKDFDINASYCLIIGRDRNVTNDVGGNVGANIDGEYSSYVNICSVSVTYKY